MRFKPLAVVLVGAFMLASTVSAQLRLDVVLIDTVATVTDSRGRFVPNLTADDFIVEEDGNPQIVTHVGESFNEPMSVGILLDTSSSMEPRIDTAVAAIDRFIRKVHKDDDIFLMTFSARTSIAQDFTDDRNRLSAALHRIQLAPETILYDAVDNALLHIERGKRQRRAILLVTDGQESGDSSDTYREVLANLRNAEVMVYALGIESEVATGSPQRGGNPPMTQVPIPGREFAVRQAGRGGVGGGGVRGGTASRGAQPPAPRAAQARRDVVDMAVLNGFAEASGGQAWLLQDNGLEMDRILDSIAEELRSQYTVGYYPQHTVRDGEWHRIEIRTKNPAYTVRARKEYFGR